MIEHVEIAVVGGRLHRYARAELVVTGSAHAGITNILQRVSVLTD